MQTKVIGWNKLIALQQELTDVYFTPDSYKMDNAATW